MTDNLLHKVTGAILSCFQTQHYLEEVKHTPYFQHKLKNTINQSLKELKKVEDLYFDNIDAIDENDTADKLTANGMALLHDIMKGYTYAQTSDLGQLICAYRLNPKKVMGISNKVHKENGASFLRA